MQRNFIIDPAKDTIMYKAWRSWASKFLCDMYQDVGFGKGIDHSWLQEAHLWVLQEYWATPDFQAKSEKSKANKASIKGGSLYCGSLTTLAGMKANMVS